MLAPLHVLIVEDNPDDAELMALRLEEDGLALVWQRVETEAEYLAALATPPDLILADWSMPHFSGQRALQLLRQRDLDIPFIIVSGSIGEEAAVEALRQGAADYVLKDRPGRLGQAARHALEEKRLRQERQRALEDLERRAAQLALLNDIGAQIARILDRDPVRVLDRAVRLVEECFGYHHVAVFTLDRERGELLMSARTGQFAHLFPPGHRLKLGQGMVGWAAQKGETLLANDVTTEPRYVNLYADVIPTRSELCVPISVGAEIVGVLDVQSPQPDAFTGNDVLVLDTLAHQIAVAIENSRLYESLQRELVERQQAEEALAELNITLEERVQQRTFELQVLYDLSQQLGYATGEAELMRLLLEHLGRAIPYDVSAVLLWTEVGGRLLIQPTRLLSPAARRVLETRVVRLFQHLSGQKVNLAQLDIQVLPAVGYDDEAPPVARLRSNAQVTLRIGEERRAIGLLAIGAEARDAFTEDHHRLLYTMAGQAALHIERLHAWQAAEYQRLVSLVETMPVGVILLDQSQRIRLINPAARLCLAALTEADLGDVLNDLGGWPVPTLLQPPPAGMSHYEILGTGKPQRTFEVTSRPMAMGSLLLLREITAERELQHQVRQQERLSALGQLTAGIAHDFNNILTGMIGLAQLWQAHPQLPETAREDLGRIAQEGQRAARLIRQMLDFSRRTTPATMPLDLGPFLKEVTRFLERTIPEHVRVSLTIQPGEYTVNADPISLQQALTNLAVNARDAMPAGGELSLHLSEFVLVPGAPPPVTGMSPGRWVVLAVADTGTGIPPEVRAHLFEPFFTTKPMGEGTGLGLSQVYGIIRQHAGYITVETGVGQGTTFRIYLPHYTWGKPRPTAEESRELPGGRGERILLVDDQEIVRHLGQAALESLGYQVLTAASGPEALALYQSAGGVDLVLTDLVMPGGLGGQQLIQALREIDPGLKALLTTGYGMPEQHDTEIQGVIPKPFELAVLARTVRKVLDS